MTQGEKLKAALDAAGMTEISLAKKMRDVSPGFLIAVTRGWATLEPWQRITIEVLLGMERGSLKGDEENAGDSGHDGAADADRGPDGNAGQDGGGKPAEKAG